MASAKGCRPTDVKADRRKSRPSSRFSHRTVYCVDAVSSSCSQVVGAVAVNVGWVRAPVEVPERRPLQCHRCFRRGHVMATCTYTAPEEDRRNRCYRCGDRGHRVSAYTSAPAVRRPRSSLGPPSRWQGLRSGSPPKQAENRGCSGGWANRPTPPVMEVTTAALSTSAAADRGGTSQSFRANGTPEEAIDTDVPHVSAS